MDISHNGHARWIVNDGADGVFDAVIINVGTCGDPRWVDYPGMPKQNEDDSRQNGTQKGKSYAEAAKSEKDAPSPTEEKHRGELSDEVYDGPLVHSSKLDNAELEGKTVLVLGSGASGVEAVETALTKGARKAIMIAR